MKKGNLICPIVNIKLELTSTDDNISNETLLSNRNSKSSAPFSKLGSSDYNKIKKTSKKLSKDGNIYEWLYYGEGGCINGMTVIEPIKLRAPKKGSFIYSCKVCYSLNKLTNFKELKKEIEEIFEHWKWSGETSYRLLEFKLIETEQFHNL